MEMDATNRETQAEKSSQYEKLTGETGRRIHYRAERFTSAKLFNGSTPEFLIGGDEVSLENLSFSGFAMTTAKKFDVGDKLPVQIIHHGLVLHEAMIEVRRVENEGTKNLVGAQITDHPIVVSELIDRYHKQRLRVRLENRGPKANNLVPPQYKAFCAEVVYLIRSYRTAIEGFNLQNNTPEALEALVYFEDKIAPLWRDIEIEGAALTLDIMDDPELLRAYKEFTEITVTPEFLDGPIFHRSYFKPRGFPGDSEMMSYVYDKFRQGETPFGQFCHHIGVESGSFLAHRMTMMRQILLDATREHEQGKSEHPLKITNLGSGAAREVSSLLEDKRYNTAAEFTLIDQDHIALKEAYQETFSRLQSLANGTGLHCVHVSFKELMMAGRLFKKLPPQDIIYSLGLVDYFESPMARLFAKSVYEQLAPGGKLIFANMRQCEETMRWSLEFIVDWSLVYRTRQEVIALVSELGAESVTVQKDVTGQMYLVTVTKPG